MGGGDGDDTIIVTAALALEDFNGGETGRDTLDLTGHRSGFDAGNPIDLTGGGDIIFRNFDVVLATSFGDVILGAEEDEEIYGNGGRDDISGNGGEDILVGGRGKDSMNGGADADIFILAPGDQVDTIRDFEVGLDKLDISAFEFASFAEVEVLIRDKNGRVQINLDGSRDVVRLNGVLEADLSEGDFILM